MAMLKPLTRDDLKPFQLRAADALAQMIGDYPGPIFEAVHKRKNGELEPFLCRLRAITGSGKTPMLAACAAAFGDAIILWTTNRGAIISQTAANLSSGGSYTELLGGEVEVKTLSDLSQSDWNDLVDRDTGLTILLSTVATFNQDGDKLKVHQDRGGTTYWEMLGGLGPQARRRPLYVFYDEGHGATDKQFKKLTELSPRALVLASSSEFPADLSDLLPGNNSEEKSEALEKRTAHVLTSEVVKEGLLKTRLFLTDCDTTREDALREANDKWNELAQKLEPIKTLPVACFIVDKTLDGIEVWKILVDKLGVDPARIAVHLSKAGQVAREEFNDEGRLIDTHKLGRTPDQLRDENYTHIIWNLALREGWDEPWAYVAYLDGHGKSPTDISQKIGRFIRQPGARAFEDPDLNAAYFYFNVEDKEFTGLLEQTRRDIEGQGVEIIAVSTGSKPRPSRSVPVKSLVSVPTVAENFGTDTKALDKILLDKLVEFSGADLRNAGRSRTRVLNLRRSAEDGELQRETARDDNAEVTVYSFLMQRLAAIDSRVVGRGGNRFSGALNQHPLMKQKLQYGSRAMELLNGSIPAIRAELNEQFELVYDGPMADYTIRSFNMVAPDLQTDDPLKRERYRVRAFDNALHAEYNGLNPFEVEIAETLDKTGYEWCRNPSQSGYGIPTPELGEGTAKFYPDFLMWAPNILWAIDPKGAHLVNDAIFLKLMGLSDVGDWPKEQPKIKAALLLQGEWTKSAVGRPQQTGKNGCSLVRRTSTGINVVVKASASDLIAQLK